MTGQNFPNVQHGVTAKVIALTSKFIHHWFSSRTVGSIPDALEMIFIYLFLMASNWSNDALFTHSMDGNESHPPRSPRSIYQPCHFQEVTMKGKKETKLRQNDFRFDLSQRTDLNKVSFLRFIVFFHKRKSRRITFSRLVMKVHDAHLNTS